MRALELRQYVSMDNTEECYAVPMTYEEFSEVAKETGLTLLMPDDVDEDFNKSTSGYLTLLPDALEEDDELGWSPVEHFESYWIKPSELNNNNGVVH